MHPRFFANLTHRNRQPELMDQPDLDQALHEQALRGLERINRISGSSGILWPSISRLARELPGGTLRILDVACGGGDVPVAIASRAARAGLNLEVAGCDISPVAISFARQRVQGTDTHKNISFFEHDVLKNPLPKGYDVVTCSLFLHHLEEDAAVVVLTRMAEAAGRLALVNDLARTRLGYLMAQVASRVLTRSPVVHVDGPLSVAGAFTPAEALALAERAGLNGASLTRHWPQRYLLSWSRP